jgi:hypothetical protein
MAAIEVSTRASRSVNSFSAPIGVGLCGIKRRRGGAQTRAGIWRTPILPMSVLLFSGRSPRGSLELGGARQLSILAALTVYVGHRCRRDLRRSGLRRGLGLRFEAAMGVPISSVLRSSSGAMAIHAAPPRAASPAPVRGQDGKPWRTGAGGGERCRGFGEGSTEAASVIGI